jgi:NAD(P)H-dependent flavin oxidoreductase YrpB (nitropropane dioxygenase family)
VKEIFLHLDLHRNTADQGAKALLDVAFSHPIKLIANALGVPPEWMVKMGKDNDVKVAALLGTKEHAIAQVKAGVDILVVSGTEAGGHCGSVSTMVLVPEVHRAIQPYGDVPILAAGGIVTGEQMAAFYGNGCLWGLDSICLVNYSGSRNSSNS